MLRVELCPASVKIVAKTTLQSPFNRKGEGRKDWIDATIYELDRLRSTLEMIDTADSAGALSTGLRLVGGQSTGSYSTEGGTVSKMVLRWYFGRWLVHGQLQHRGW